MASISSRNSAGLMESISAPAWSFTRIGGGPPQIGLRSLLYGPAAPQGGEASESLCPWEARWPYSPPWGALQGGHMAEDEDLELTDEEKEAIREARKARKEKERNAPVRVKEYEISRKDAIRKGIIEPDDDDDD